MLGTLPSKERLQELGRSGLVAHSPLATRAAIVAGVFGAMLLGFGRILELLLRTHGEFESLGGVLGDVLEPFILVVSIIALVGLFVGLFGSLIQTRLVAGLFVLSRGGRGRDHFEVFVVLLQLCLVGVVSMACTHLLFREVLLVTRIDSVLQIGAYFGELAIKICKLVVVVAGVLAILAMFVCRMAFLFKHRQRARRD